MPTACFYKYWPHFCFLPTVSKWGITLRTHYYLSTYEVTTMGLLLWTHNSYILDKQTRDFCEYSPSVFTGMSKGERGQVQFVGTLSQWQANTWQVYQTTNVARQTNRVHSNTLIHLAPREKRNHRCKCQTYQSQEHSLRCRQKNVNCNTNAMAS